MQPFLSACTNKQGFKNDNTHPVVIIGAGAAGLISGYLLKQQGVSVKILEAASNFGGRMKRTTTFADFPIPLGAEWIHVKPNILSEIVNDDSVNIDVKVEKYNPDIDCALYEGEKISIKQIEMNKESKFVNSTWFDFFEQYIVPSVEKHIIYGAVVEKIDYLADEIKIETSDKVYLALIGFNPTTNDGEKLYYDAAYGQNSNLHILGLFAVGNESLSYLRLTDEERVKYILHELDKIFDGKASAHYVKHIFQNWDIEPHINGAYIRDNEDWTAVKKLGESADGRLFFAGDAYTDGEDWSAVNNAVHSAKRAVQAIMDS
ncbi:flavin monoamine oxidase family protein [Pseudoalteromonas luteoviolacea]|uniref:flavin monoamine oxidase family protein n=1 Tax=Pseudoalteromonas luteoviolacea TaxID=43657 RepID=UPI00159F25D0|nr:FAD-dependent oxidoreductase [Pseudoalteromonas luteoviolacea]